MDSTAPDTSVAGSNSVNPLTQDRSDENRKPSNSDRFSPTDRSSPSVQHSGHQDHAISISQDAPAQLDTVPTNTDAVADFDALLASLDSDDEEELTTEDKIPTVGEARAVPTVLLETSPNRGLDDAEVLSRRKRYGWNLMKEENPCILKKFLKFFVGPIQCVMLVGWDTHHSSGFLLKAHFPRDEWFPADMAFVVGFCTGCRLARLDRSWSYCRLALA